MKRVYWTSGVILNVMKVDILLELSSIYCFIFILIFTATYMTNKYLLYWVFSGLYVGSSVARIVLGTLQGILEKAIGTETILQCRRVVFLCHSTHSVISYIAAIWAFVLYIECKTNCDPENKDALSDQSSGSTGSGPTTERELSKWEQIKKVFPYMKHFYWRIIMFSLSYSTIYFYYPCVVPFCLNISRPMKLLGSVLYAYSDLNGRTIGSTINEELDEKDKKDNESHFKFLFSKDIKFILLLLFVHGSLISLVIMTWNNHEYSRLVPIICAIIIFSTHGFGITLTRTMKSIHAAIAYFNKQKKKDGNSNEMMIPDDVMKYSNTMIDIVTFINAGSMLFFTFLTNVFVELIENHRSSRPYLIRHNTRGLTEDIIDIILNIK